MDGNYFKCFKKHHKENPDKQITINSAGGRSFEALKTAKYIKDNNIDIKVNYMCLSACTTLLFSSQKSTVCSGAVIGVHSNSLKPFDVLIREPLNRTKKYLFKNNNQRDFNFDFYLKKVNSTPYKSMYYLTEKEMIDNNLVANIIDCH